MTDARPTPEEMLERARAEDPTGGLHRRRGRLKLFFGYAAGVGKTYAMLLAARQQRATGRDVVVGYVEPHGRRETEALLEGLEQLPTLEVPYRGATLREFDLDAALARKPELLLVDELAHTNALGARHVKRWQDVDELLAAGVDVYSTLNVQHIESLNDVIAQISGVVVRETLPDSVVESADDVVLVDLPPEELLERLKQGKVYVPEQAVQALERFFRRENLAALRELALRQTAERVHDDVESARQSTSAAAPWPTDERLLVCVGPSPTSAKVVRAAKRVADRLAAPWFAVHVASDSAAQHPADEEAVHRHLLLAEQLGAEVVRIAGADVAAELLAFAQRRNVTKIVLGKTAPGRSRLLALRRTFVDRLIDASGDIDVIVVRGVEAPRVPTASVQRRRTTARHWLGAALSMAVATGAALAFHAWGFSEANLVMVYLLAVVFSAVRFGAGPAIACSVASVLLFDVLFTEPYFWIAVDDSQYLVTFAVMLVVGLTASTLTASSQRQAESARASERRTEALYRLTRRLAGTSDVGRLAAEAERTVGEVFDAYALVFLPDAHGKIRPVLDDLHLFAASAAEFAAAQWVFDHKEPAGVGTDTLPSMQALYLPLAAPSGVVGVVAVQASAAPHAWRLRDRHLLDTIASHVALAIERARLAGEAQNARLAAETEKLRSSLLSAVSHDIRTPLAGVAGAASTLEKSYDSLDADTRRELLRTINDEAERLSQLVDNLLHMTRLSSGKIDIDRQWRPVDEVIETTLARMQRQLAGRRVDVRLDEQTTLGQFDAVLIERLLVNLLENAVKYSPPDSPIELAARATPVGVEFEVADRGRGFSPDELEHVFELFYRGATERPDRRGLGLGLAICQAIVDAHGGEILARNRAGGGAVVRVAIPHADPPPAIGEAALEPQMR